MARLYPTNILDDIRDSESLDDDYTAFRSVKTVCRDDSGKMLVGEADVVLLRQRRGLLVIDAKGGGIGYDRESRQYRAHDQYGTHRIDIPCEQAAGLRNSAQRRRDDLSRAVPECSGVDWRWNLLRTRRRSR